MFVPKHNKIVCPQELFYIIELKKIKTMLKQVLMDVAIVPTH